MTIGELVDAASDRRLTVEDIDRVRKLLCLSIEAVCDRFAIVVGQRYLRRNCSFDYGDTAMNHLYVFAMEHAEKLIEQQFWWQIYLAFDAGEYQGEPQTRRLLEVIEWPA